MPNPRRNVLAVLEETSTPPIDLPENQYIARVIEAKGKNVYQVELPEAFSKERILVELPAKFRSTVWIKRGGFVVVDKSTLADRENKLGGEIVNIVREEKQWRNMSYWPQDFVKTTLQNFGTESDEEEEESLVGKMPPSDSENES